MTEQNEIILRVADTDADPFPTILGINTKTVVHLAAEGSITMGARVGLGSAGMVVERSRFDIGIALETATPGDVIRVYLVKPIILKRRLEDGPYQIKYGYWAAQDENAIDNGDENRYLPEFVAPLPRGNIEMGSALPLGR
jgi:hypothetical protein